MLEDIERGSLGGEDTPGRAADLAQDRAALNPGAIINQWLVVDPGIDFMEDHPGDIDAGDDALILGQEPRDGAQILRHGHAGGDIAAPNVFIECEPDDAHCLLVHWMIPPFAPPPIRHRTRPAPGWQRLALPQRSTA